MDINKVIYLGHKANVPLMYLRSELTDGFEPHDHIYPARHPRAASVQPCRVPGGVYPGCGLGGYQEGAIPVPSLEARLRLIYRYLRFNWFILPFD